MERANLPKYITLEGAVKSIAEHRGCAGWGMSAEEWAMELLEDVIENEADGGKDGEAKITLSQLSEEGSHLSC